MNVAQVEPHAAGFPIRAWGDSEGYGPALAEALAGAKTVAFDDEGRAAFLLDVLTLPNHPNLQRASGVTRGLRIRKDAAELAALRAAGATVDAANSAAMALCRVGRTEAEIEQALRVELLSRPPQSTVAFTIVASGPNGASPHHETGRRPLQNGDVVVLDYGTRLNGYHSDITVTCSVGEPSDPEARKVYQTVYEAQQAAIRAVRPGAKCCDIDAAARGVIDAAGYGPHFLHRTGHGIGVQGHEPPYLTGANDETLEEGMVFSIEPGIYLPGRFGVRLEIITAVGKDEAELINQPSRPELPIVSQ